MTTGVFSRRSEEEFTVTYRGPAVEAGRMDVQALAPALIALSRSIQEAQQVLDPLAPAPALDVRAVREGSFAVDLVVSEGLLQGALDLLAGRDATAIVNLAELIGVVFGGYKLTRWLNKRIRGRETLENGMVRITFDTGETLTIPQESLIIAADKGFREAARDAVEPLRHEGITSVELGGRADQETVVVQPDDLPGFDLPPTEEQELTDVEQVSALRPVTVAFTEGNKWRVSDGESTFFATILDQPFLDRVEAGEAFTKSDILRARVRTRQWRDADGDLRTEREILEVLDHVRGSRDVPLPFEEDAG